MARILSRSTLRAERRRNGGGAPTRLCRDERFLGYACSTGRYTSDLCHDAVNMEHGSFDIFEVVAFAHRLTAVERADATNALKKKWGL
ncbi:MAG: hypothetical protein HYZ29_01340 [Myxococcales bacterium]|nr:hypothetical protein [Myxococcales bacterium]